VKYDFAISSVSAQNNWHKTKKSAPDCQRSCDSEIAVFAMFVFSSGQILTCNAILNS
jgi:hypothetical protein